MQSASIALSEDFANDPLKTPPVDDVKTLCGPLEELFGNRRDVIDEAFCIGSRHGLLAYRAFRRCNRAGDAMHAERFIDPRGTRENRDDFGAGHALV